MMTLLASVEDRGRRTYRYRIDFENGAVLQRFTFDDENRVASIESEAAEMQSR
jgi:hypothetical protein